MAEPASASGIRVYWDRRILAVLLLGVSSGLPLALTGATLSARLALAGIDKTAIGLFALVALPYTLKFAWAPLIDRLAVPVLCRRFGRRRGWALAIQAALALAILGLGTADPARGIVLTALWAILVAFCSASQDVVIDAIRVESLDPAHQGAGAAAIVFGYRGGMLISGAGALYLAALLPWSAVYAVMALAVGIGAATILAMPEPATGAPPPRTRSLPDWLNGAVVAPLRDFMRRPAWPWILLFITLYMLGEVYAGAMAMPFYIEMGFTKVEIAGVTKLFGLGATILGVALGGGLVGRWGVTRSLFVCGLFQASTIPLYLIVLHGGHDTARLAVAIGLENLTAGMATASFVAYLSGLCSPAYTATQYALLSSFFGFGRDLLGSPSGWFADRLGWPAYFIFAASLAVPGLLLLGWLARRGRQQTPAGATRAAS